MRKKIATIVLTTALAASQAVCTYAAGSAGTDPVINSGSSSDGSSYDSGVKTGTTTSSTSATKSGQGNNVVQIGVGETRLWNLYRTAETLLQVFLSQWSAPSMALTADVL